MGSRRVDSRPDRRPALAARMRSLLTAWLFEEDGSSRNVLAVALVLVAFAGLTGMFSLAVTETLERVSRVPPL
jgi:hypothetical protein